MSDTKLMDIEAGGEQTQYEGIRQFNNLPHTKSEMRTTLAGDRSDAKAKREDTKFAHKLELGERTSGISGYTNRGPVETEDDAAKSRREQGYGPGSGVGA
ncbi:uncharacterized protein DSM5745_02185 [Aspergillus mulundensis]|uniref:Uncharacterized protein n=1 Tax=Aspergillus mulundensis TaxID=1810919 RepID=A0A3D8SVT5_9EURO|nr:Uncharacterized protein DSM5745_02185 [Aspergillus mulundensis]RDW90410.1 Uncharacterized protein DSM5745_02185 [Aspergillus mulundensis]